jgi:LemA protein
MLITTLALSPTIITLIVIGVIVLLLVFYFVGVYNKLVQLRERFKNGFSQIEVQLKRRHDLIPNLVETAKGYMKHEQETLTAVIEARNQAVSATSKAAADPSNGAAIQGLAASENMLTQTLGKLFALSEAYPDLKANQNMMALQEELATTENKVAFSRQAYNDGVMTYNSYRNTVPPVFIANMTGFAEAPYLEFDDAEAIKEVPKVAF